MKTLNIEGFRVIIDNIRKHQAETFRLNSGLSQIMNEDVYSGFGGRLLDNYIDLINFIFNDDNDLIEWYVFENEFGIKGLQKEINKKLVRINNDEELFRQLYIQLKKKKRRKNEK